MRSPLWGGRCHNCHLQMIRLKPRTKQWLGIWLKVNSRAGQRQELARLLHRLPDTLPLPLWAGRCGAGRGLLSYPAYLAQVWVLSDLTPPSAVSRGHVTPLSYKRNPRSRDCVSDVYSKALPVAEPRLEPAV